MIVDTSAIIAILRQEPEADILLDKLLRANTVRLSAASLLEARIVAERDGGRTELDEFLRVVEMEIVAVDAAQVDQAFQGFLRYGKGRHPAGLNYGDCFSYALSRQYGEPLLFKGGDFSLTDVESA